jgi:hypothetical protein
MTLIPIVIFFATHRPSYATIQEIRDKFGNVESELDHLVSLGILSFKDFDRGRYWFNKRNFYPREIKRSERSWYSAEKKIQAVMERKAQRKAA